MQVASIRLGFANNSSSSHSILVGAPRVGGDMEAGNYKFGWEAFHLTERDEKLRYMAAYVVSACRLSKEQAAQVVAEICGPEIIERAPWSDGYVDHQSVEPLPSKANGEPHFAFMRALARDIAGRTDVTIAGGNDNGGEFDPGGVPYEVVEGFQVKDLAAFKIRRSGDWWTLMNKHTGAKFTLSFEKDPSLFVASETPELVDVKITDWCGHGCPWCYQGSTKQGKHADLAYLKKLFEEMSRREVFEVALGGGEPTAHPDFGEIVIGARKVGLVPNFTSFNMDWTRHWSECVRDNCGAFAVSSVKPEVIDDVATWNDRARFGGKSKACGTIQIPLGCYDMQTIAGAILHAVECGVGVTFLGYKEHGRAAGRVSLPYDDILGVVERARVTSIISDGTRMKGLRFGADSLFVREFKEALGKVGVSELFMVGREGAFSCYVDAVEKQMGPSSFCAPEEMHAIPEDLLNLFSRFPYAVKEG